MLGESVRDHRIDDAWLQPWLPLLRHHAGTRCVLELGCGEGRDTVVLHAAGFRVVALDCSAAAIAAARIALPDAQFIHGDLRAPLPFERSDVGAIVASLCLHYFDWATTRQIIEGLKRCLSPKGMLLCRVNSTRDIHHGAQGHPRIEPGYYQVGDEQKRFFARADVEAAFAEGWQIVTLEERTIDRYRHPKVVWELVALAH